jgi:hypothetical protein
MYAMTVQNIGFLSRLRTISKLNRLVREGKPPLVDEEVVYNRFSAHGSGSRHWASSANKRLNSPFHQLVVSCGAIWRVDVLHDNGTNWPIDDVSGRESVVEPGNLDVGTWFGVQAFCNPVLPEGSATVKYESY